jgi:hypothetical protein
MPNKIPAFPVIVALLFLLAGFVLYGSAGHDDSHITFWASYTLSEYGDILNYNGARVEQSSSLLLTVLIALVAKITTLDVVIVGYALTYASGAIALLLCWQLAQKRGQSNISAGQAKGAKCYFDPVFHAVVLLATSPAFLLWNTSGMESTLAAACVLNFILIWGDVLSDHEIPKPGTAGMAALATLMLVSVRPEMVMLATALVFTLFLYRRIHRLRGKVGIIVFYSTVLLSICSLVMFRFIYFGSPVPLPVYAKVTAFSLQRITDGTVYLLRYGISNPVIPVGIILALPALVHLFRQKTDEPQFHLLLANSVLLIYSAFIVCTGGDWMQAGRFLVPVLPLAAISTANGLQGRFGNHRMLVAAVVVILAINLLGNVMAIKSESSGIPIWSGYRISEQHRQTYSLFEQYNQEHLRDMETIDQLNALIDAVPERTGTAPVTLMSGQSGMVYYYVARHQLARQQQTASAFGKLRFYDTHALTEASFLKCKLLDDIPRSSMGLFTSLDDFFTRQPALTDDCGIPEPDIVYDINDITRQLPQRIAAFGYTMTYKEGGKVLENTSPLPANSVFSPDFIMVANDLLPSLGNPETIMMNYNRLPVVQRW